MTLSKLPVCVYHLSSRFGIHCGGPRCLELVNTMRETEWTILIGFVSPAKDVRSKFDFLSAASEVLQPGSILNAKDEKSVLSVALQEG